MPIDFRTCCALAVLSTMLALSGCGGSSSSSVGGGSGGGDGGGPTVAQRSQAASTTAENNALCVNIKPFYWEIGDMGSALASASVAGTGSQSYSASTVMSIASASKWFYSTYFVQKKNGVLSADDIKFFNFWSGYTNFSPIACEAATTVGNCLDISNPTNNGSIQGDFVAATENKFDYGGGHMQKHAALNGLASMDNAQLATEIRSQIGTDVGVSYGSPQLAGGVFTSAAEYAKMLRRIVGGTMVMKSVLGTHPVCVDPATCPLAISTPSPRGEQWHYSIGHWVEDDPDPKVGDGAFSSPGAFGFYPWIDASKTYYGIVARVNPSGAITSVQCGRLIRRAWVTGTAQ